MNSFKLYNILSSLKTKIWSRKLTWKRDAKSWYPSSLLPVILKKTFICDTKRRQICQGKRKNKDKIHKGNLILKEFNLIHITLQGEKRVSLESPASLSTSSANLLNFSSGLYVIWAPQNKIYTKLKTFYTITAQKRKKKQENQIQTTKAKKLYIITAPFQQMKSNSWSYVI